MVNTVYAIYNSISSTIIKFLLKIDIEGYKLRGIPDLGGYLHRGVPNLGGYILMGILNLGGYKT